MEKYQNKAIRVIAILFMLSTAPLTVTYSYAENEEGLELESNLKDQKLVDSSQQKRLGVILTEKMVNGKLEVEQFTLPENTTQDDMNRILSLEGTSGWSYVNFQKYHSGIVLFDGKASKSGEKPWKISVNGTLNLSKGELDLEVIGKSNNSNPKIDQNPLSEDLDYRVIFSGKLVESDEETEIAIAIMNSGLKNPEKSPDIKLLQFGHPTSELLNFVESTKG